MSGSYSADQFKYLIEDDPAQLQMNVRAYHPDTEREIASLSVKVRSFPTGTRKTRVPTKQPQIRGAFVHPDYQRQGIGSEMFDIASHHIGGPPMHDTSVTAEAQAWAAKVGGALHPEMKTGDTFTANEVARGFEKHRTATYSDRASETHQQRPKPRQLAFKGM